MSQRRISRSPALSKLQSDGYDVAITGGYVVLRGVPYVTAQKEVLLCVLADAYNDASDRPGDHTIHMAGELPCDENGVLQTIMFAGEAKDQSSIQISPDLTLHWRFSVKKVGENNVPVADEDYYSKFVRYVERLGRHVKALGSDVSAQTYPVVSPDPEEESVFQYLDTATTRARIAPISKKLEHQRVAILGLGGTGSYIFDLVAKTPVREIHLYDPDVFHQHNAFRAPGAPSIGQLQKKLTKVDHFASIYGNMRTGIVPHKEGLTPENAGELTGMSFVFIAMDSGEAKHLAIDKLTEASVPFVDCGIGVYEVEQALAGVVRVTTGTASKHDHVLQQVPFTDGDVNNEYARNIQIADLNALNAALAVIRWKKVCTFYGDLEREHSSTYSIDGNCIANGDKA